MKLFSLLLVIVPLAGVSCERHDFEETRKLHEHSAAHEKHAEHEQPSGHEGEKKAE
jgi:hypothetical protein